MGFEKVRKFERLFLMNTESNEPRPIDKENRILIGTYFYDFKRGTEKYTPAKKPY